MANFECKIVKIDAKENHPNADRLTLYKIGGYTCISNKLEDGSDRYNVGDLVVYIPENALLPDWLLKTMGFWNYEKDCGTLSGKNGNRVKPLKLRGIFSCGLIYPGRTIKEYDEGFSEDVVVAHGYDKDTKFIFAEGGSYTRYVPLVEGCDMKDFLDITKYEPPIPATMGGEVFNCDLNVFEHFDVEPIQKHMDMFKNGEEVVMESKIHGTNCRYVFSVDETNEETFGENNDIFISSKGLGDKGLAFKNNVSNKYNIYINVFKNRNIEEKVKQTQLYKDCIKNKENLTIMGEIYGDGVQDLTYGLKNEIDFALFDVYVGKPKRGRYLNYDEVKDFAQDANLKMVDVLYRGPYSWEKVKEFTDGYDTFGKNPNQIREGIVIKPLNERFDNKIGRVMLKSVSEAYKLRKGGSEFN